MPENSSARVRLDSWKEIADYLKRDTRTAIRWEQERGMPVHRVPGGKRQVVFAFTDEIDAWLLSQEPKDRAADAGDAGAHKSSIIQKLRAKLVLALLIAACFLAGVGIIIFLLARSRSSAPVHPLSLHPLTEGGYQKQGLATDGIIYALEWTDR